MNNLQLIDPIKFDRSHIEKLILNNYTKNYEDVDVTMISGIFNSHDSKTDEFGYMTLRKEIKIIKKDNDVIGFTTLTWKRGGSVKTGPTILYSAYRGMGIGPKVQLEIQKYVKSKKGRKTYGTTSTGNLKALNYMLRADYMIEAHLSSHYHAKKDEIVLGRTLIGKKIAKYEEIIPGDLTNSHVSKASKNDILNNKKIIYEMISKYLVQADDLLILNIAKCSTVDIKEYGKKPKRLYFIRQSNSIVGMVLLIPKRGGTIKINIFGDISLDLVNKTITDFRLENKNLSFRKVSLFFPEIYGYLQKELSQSAWSCEGLLNQPYKSGVNFHVYSRFVL